MPARPGSSTIAELVERFARHEKQYCSSAYNETQTRREFIDPFFEALGWDVNNRKGYSERYKEVIHEDAIKVKGGTKAPDYSFRHGGSRLFFVEAKKPSVNIYQDSEPAFQVRRYAWTASLKLSIVTNFREFAVYDTRLEPRQADKASIGRVRYLKYHQYMDEWDSLADIFSRDAIPVGAFDDYADSTRAKKGTAGVDESFLKTIDEWRLLLAKNIALRNHAVSEIDLNYAVQRTIDRILFLRICEDRGIEKYGTLRFSGRNIYEFLRQRFREADDRFNSGLFHFHKEHDRPEPRDELTLSLNIDDAPLKTILRQLYYPESPFEFSVFPADVLGQVYEQFLGKVITLKGHRAIVDTKLSVRKAGGIFYTPSYIVDHMIEGAVGTLCEGKTPKDLSEAAILDPACGSGSFLIVAYQYLLDWHLSWYSSNNPEKHARGRAPAIYQMRNAWHLTTSERKRILLNNIYGVDVDAQAVETTKLSLLLKVLEGETDETVGQNLRLFQERALPDLERNILCGNSLIAPDLYSELEQSEVPASERYRINAFTYSLGFPKVMKRGGFDCIVGNPPYVDIRTLSELEVAYVASHYATANNRLNLFAVFMERSLALLRPGFSFSMIVPTAIAAQSSYKALRQLILEKADISELVRLPNESFGARSGDVLVDTVIVGLRSRRTPSPPTQVVSYGATYKRIVKIDPDRAPHRSLVDSRAWNESNECVWTFNAAADDSAILAKCELNSWALEKCAEICLGLTPYDKYKGHTQEQISSQVFHANFKKDDSYKKLLAGNDVSRYNVKWNGELWISYGPWLGASRERRFFTERRILVKQIVDRSSQRIWAGSTSEELYNTQNAFNVLPRPPFALEYLLAVINSRLMSFYHRKRHLDEFKRLYQKVLIKDFRRFPIQIVEGTSSKSRTHDRIVGLTKRMIQVTADLGKSNTPHQRDVLDREAEHLDEEIDDLVFTIYGLDDTERAIVRAAVH